MPDEPSPPPKPPSHDPLAAPRRVASPASLQTLPLDAQVRELAVEAAPHVDPREVVDVQEALQLVVVLLLEPIHEFEAQHRAPEDDLVAVREELRRSGYGRAIMVAAEDECRALGVVSVGLNVFGHNRGAQALYEQMGFEVTGIQMSKRLD